MLEQMDHVLRSWVRALFFRRQLDRDLDDEIQAHLESLTDENIAKGMTSEQARRAAQIELGGTEQVKEAVRAVRMGAWLDTTIEDVRFGLRLIRRKPMVSAIAVLTLALGIGANTAIFSVVSAVLLKPLPFKGASRLTMIWQADAAHRGTGAYFDTYREFEEWKQDSKSFEKLAAITWARIDTTMRLHGKVESVLAIPVSADFFSTLGVQAERGRTFTLEDSRNACAAVLSDGFWNQQLGSGDIIGHTLTINDQPCLITGIMPKDFTFYPKQTQLWTLIPPDGEYAKNPWTSTVGVVGLLKPGVSRASAEIELSALQKRIISETTLPLLQRAEPDVLDLQYEFVWLTGRNLRTSLVLLLAAVTFVLLIACVNLATLFLGRAIEREQEFGIRAALGATRSRTIRQLLTEGLLLAVVGALLGIFLASAAIRYLNAVNPIELPPGNPIAIDWRVLGFTGVLSILSVAVFALVPAWQASRYNVNALLKRNTTSSQVAAKVFVVAEVALSLMLLVGAGLLTKSLVRLTSMPLGFEPTHLVAGNIDLSPKTYSVAARRLAFYDEVKNRVASLPGVSGVAFGPLAEGAGNILDIEGRSAPDPQDMQNAANLAEVDSDYFRMLKIPLLEGRGFDKADEQKALPVAIVNEALAKRFFDTDPIGQHIRFWRPGNDGRWLTIVGVVGNIKGFTVFKEMGYVTDPAVYVPLAQATDPRVQVAILVRSSVGTGSLFPAIQNAFSSVDANLPTPNLTTMSDWLSQFYSQPRFRAGLLTVFAGLGLLLCAVGIFGVLSESVTQHRHEIGIKMALGAQSRDILCSILGQGAHMALTGVALGLGASYGLTRLMVTMLFGVTPDDPLTFTAVAALLLAIAFVACWIPAQRAMKVDPMVALRYE